MSSMGAPPPALPCSGCRSLPRGRPRAGGCSSGALPDGSAPGDRHVMVLWHLLPSGKETRSEGELFSQGKAEKWTSPGDRHSPRSVLGHSQALQRTTQAETAPGLPLQHQSLSGGRESSGSHLTPSQTTRVGRDPPRGSFPTQNILRFCESAGALSWAGGRHRHSHAGASPRGGSRLPPFSSSRCQAGTAPRPGHTQCFHGSPGSGAIGGAGGSGSGAERGG